MVARAAWNSFDGDFLNLDFEGVGIYVFLGDGEIEASSHFTIFFGIGDNSKLLESCSLWVNSVLILGGLLIL